MRSINKMVMLLALVSLSSMAYAQNNESQEGQTLLRTEQLAAKLELDETQKAALDKQLKAAKAQKEAQREKAKAFREEMRRDAFLARQAQEKELKSILTDEQWAAYQKLKAEQQGHARERLKGKKRRHAQHKKADSDGN